MDRDIDLEKVGRIMMAGPLAVALGLRLVAVETGKATLEAPWRADLVGDVERDIIAGGVVTALIDRGALGLSGNNSRCCPDVSARPRRACLHYAQVGRCRVAVALLRFVGLAWMVAQ